jgi:hypothetical protein
MRKTNPRPLDSSQFLYSSLYSSQFCTDLSFCFKSSLYVALSFVVNLSFNQRSVSSYIPLNSSQFFCVLNAYISGVVYINK